MAKIKSFQFWTQLDVEKMFNLVQVPSLPELDDLLRVKSTLTALEKASLDALRSKLLEMASGWGEEDLKIQFIGPVINFADMAHRKYRLFFDCNIKAEINDETIGGKVDALLANGFFAPETPFFFLQEFKREKGRDTDPAGQLLAAMVVSHQLNGSNDSLYGCYITGRNWFFLIMKGKEYAISDVFVATQEDVYQVVAMLRKIKELFEKKINYVPQTT